jgi:Flp pilus assembly protein TadG
MRQFTGFLRTLLPGVYRHRSPDSKSLRVTVMSMMPPFAQLRKIAGQFTADSRGNIAVMFAIALLPLIGFVGAAIDYSRANKARSAMQAAVDSAALMVSKDFSSGIIASSEIDAKAQKYFKAMYTNTDASSIQVAATYTPNAGNGSAIKLTSSGSINTEFMKVVGIPQMNIGSTSTTNWGEYVCAWLLCSTRPVRWSAPEKSRR